MPYADFILANSCCRKKAKIFARSAFTLGILWLWTFSAGILWADRLADDRFAHLGVHEGLGGRVLDIAQDHQGFLWFAMQSGLRQYDGRLVKPHLHDPDDPYSISDNYVHRLLVDSNGDLWIATQSGRLNKWLPEEEGFLTLSLELGGTPTDLDELAPGRLLVVLNQAETVQISIADHTVEVVESLESTDCVVVDPTRQSVWGFGSRGLTKHALDDLSEQQVFPWPPSFIEERDFFLDCTQQQDGSLWGSAYIAGAIHFRPQTQKLTTFQHSHRDNTTLTGNDLAAVLEDSEGNLWIAGFSGLNRYLPESAAFERFTSNPIDRRSLINHQIHSLFEDRTGQLWLGTDAGAARFDPFRENFLFYSHDPTQEISAPAGSIRSFVEDDQGRLWVGSRSHGIARMDREAGETIYYSTDPGGSGGIPDDTAWALSYEAPNRLWVGGETGVSRLNVETGTWRRFETNKGGESTRIVTLFRDRLGSLWIGSDAGLYRHNTGSDSFEPISLGIASRILAMADDSKGRLFVGMEGAGLAVLDLRDGRMLKSWPGGEFAPGQLTHGIVTALVTIPGEQETIWAATLGGGLHRLESDETWSRFGVEQGLPSDSIRALQAEPGGTLWLSTGIETVRFEPQTGNVHSFQSADGFPSLVHTKASYRSPAGELFFGGLDGFVAFFPDSIQVDASPPQVILTDLRIGNTSMRPQVRQPESPLTRSITLADEVTLRHFQNNFSIELAALHFGDPTRNRFAYLLEGVDTDWVEVSAERSFARYSRIPAGRHLFRAKAVSRDGVWSEEEARLEVLVLPAPWRSWWAWTLYSVAAVGLVLWWVMTKIARLELEKELQEKELKVLRGMLPICATCKKIRDDEGEWEPLERYLDSHSEAQLTHGICPQCAVRILGKLPSEASS